MSQPLVHERWGIRTAVADKENSQLASKSTVELVLSCLSLERYSTASSAGPWPAFDATARIEAAMSYALFDLMKLRRRQLVPIFQELDAPSVQEMNGEFRATLLDQGKWTHNFLSVLAFNMPGVWISKAFRPLSDQGGHGYNSFRIGSDIKKIYPMVTFVGPSRLDGRPSYHLNYGPLNRRNVPAWTRLAGEVRKYRDGLYLGIGTADCGLSAFRREQPFLLEGPLAAFDESVFAA